MSRTDSEMKDESGLHHLAALLRRSSTTIVDGERDEQEWRRLRDASRAVRAQKGSLRLRWRAWYLMPVGAAAVVAVMLWHLTKPKLICKVEGKEVAAAYFAAGKDKPVDLDFSDGSTVHLVPDSQLRLASAESTGATLQLERGQVDVAIRHRRDTRWRLDAGPFTVRITGTHFCASWDPVQGRFDVALLEGSLIVDGMNGPLPLAAGQRLRASRSGTVAIEAQTIEAQADDVLNAHSKEAEPSVPAAVDEQSTTSPSPATNERRAQGKPRCSFSPLLARGRFQEIVTQAKNDGLRRVLSECPIAELFALSDASRYLHNLSLGEDTLLAIRQRSSTRAGKAAFFLARLEEIRGRPSAALRWYSMVSESDGIYRTEALAAKRRIERGLPDERPGAHKK